MQTPRPPIIVILGHVDHGKTSLLDYIRKSAVAQREVGGITQKIGAYTIDTGIQGYDTSEITFIDTPGHEAFTKIRSRGAQICDIAILIIDAKDSIMPQTVESIEIIKKSGIPFIVALNKADLPEAHPEKVKNDLLKYNIQTEDKGGTVAALAISAKTGQGVQELLEAILLIAHERKLAYDPEGPLSATVIETKKDKRGIVGSCIITNGTLHVGDTVYVGQAKIKVRALMNDLGQAVKSVRPSQAFELLGFESMPEVGNIISSFPQGVKNEERAASGPRTLTLDDVLGVQQEEQKKLSLIIKADSQGSLEAILNTLEDNPRIEIHNFDLGEITKHDIFMAKTTKSIVVGFNVKPNKEALEAAKEEKIVVKTYDIIYEMLDELLEVTYLLEEKENKAKNLKGEAKVLAQFIIDGETVYGLKVIKGKFNLNDPIEIWRNDKLVGKTKLTSLRIRAKTVDEVKRDEECGMMFYPKLDLSVGDVVKCIL